MECDVAVVGGGVLGVTTAFWFSELYDCSVIVLEKDTDIARHATLRNTGLVHRPYYMDPGKRRLFALSAEKSYGLWKALASRFGLPWLEAGTLMVATEERQLDTLEKYSRWGVENGMSEEEYELLDGAGAKRAEPAVECLGAILSRRDASTDFSSLTRAVWDLASESGARLLPNAEVTGTRTKDDRLEVTLGDGRSLQCSLLVNAAGGGALGVARMMGLAEEYADLHFRGEYWEVDPGRAPRVTRSVYSVARHERFPFLDPHFIVRADGRGEVGPNAVLVSGPDAYEGVGGAWRFASKLAQRPLGPKARLFANGEFLSLVWDEWRSSLSKRAMCERAGRFLPSLKPEMLTARGLPGIRSSLVGREGFVPEALVMRGQDSVHVLNYNSPGATGAPVFAANLVRGLEADGYLDSFGARAPRETIWDYSAGAALK